MKQGNGGFVFLLIASLLFFFPTTDKATPRGGDEVDIAVVQIEEGLRSVFADAAANAGQFADAKSAAEWKAKRNSQAIEKATQVIKDREQSHIGSTWDAEKAAELWSRWGNR